MRLLSRWGTAHSWPEGQARLLTPTSNETPLWAQKKTELVRMAPLGDPGKPGAKDIYVLLHKRKPMTPMAENMSSSVQIPGLSLTSCLALGKLLKGLHFRFFILKKRLKLRPLGRLGK